MYIFDSRVRYNETDTNEVLSVEGIIDYMQDCATFHSDNEGKGIDYLAERNLCWILNAWQVVINRQPKAGEKIKIGTNAYGYKGIYGFRNFVILDESGEKCAYANSVWVLVDIRNYKPTRITETAFIGLNPKEKLEMDYADRKIHIPVSLSPEEPIKVMRGHLDSHLHVNNGKYVGMAAEYLPEDIQVRQLRVQYLKSAMLGDIIIPYIGQINNKYYVSLNSAENEPYAVLEYTY
jgi:medium-chain acyl-[acyl-carrier-protein] hydrolase